MKAFWYLFGVVLFAVHRCEDEVSFNEYKIMPANYMKMDWMKCIDNNAKLSTVSIPGTHQSLKMEGYNDYRNFQAWGLRNQLTAGVRFLDMDLWERSGNLYVKNNAIYYYAEFEYTLNKLEIFLKDKTSEAVLLRLTPDDDHVSRKAKNMLSHYGIDVWKSQDIPTMREVRGKIVLIQSSYFDWGLPVSATVLGTGDKEKELKQNIKMASEHCAQKMMLTDTGAKGQFEKPRTVAETVNKQLYSYLSTLYNAKSVSCLGMFAMDFPGPKLIHQIIDFNCGFGSNSEQSSPSSIPRPAPVQSTTTTPVPSTTTTPVPSTTTTPVPSTTTSPVPSTTTSPVLSTTTTSVPSTTTTPVPSTTTTPVPSTTTTPIPSTTTSPVPSTTTSPVPSTTTSPVPSTTTTPVLSTTTTPVPSTTTTPVPSTTTSPVLSTTTTPIPSTTTSPVPLTTTSTLSTSTPIHSPETSKKLEPVSPKKKKICHRVHKHRQPSPLVS